MSNPLEHYSAYLKGVQRTDGRYLEAAEARL